MLSEQRHPLAASVHLLQPSGRVVATSQADTGNGKFAITIKPASLSLAVAVSHAGYQPDTIKIDDLKADVVDLGIITLLQQNVMLGEVTVRGSNVTMRDGVKRIVPTALHRHNSTDALIMLDKMNLSRISVDPLSKQITMDGGGTMKVLINGREASAAEVSSIAPALIKRIDYHDTPEARYGNADVVLDFITGNDEAGGRLYTSLWQGVATAFGEDYVSMKLNKRNSQLSIDYGLAYRNWHHLSREYEETFALPSDTLERSERGMPGMFKYANHTIGINYNWQKARKQFNLSMGTGVKNAPFKQWNSEIDENSLKAIAADNAMSSSFSPYLQAYWQVPVASNQDLLVNVAGQYSDGKYDRQYEEIVSKSENRRFSTNNKEKQRGYGISAVYEARIEKWGTLSTGLNFDQQFISSDFRYSSVSTSSNHQFMRLSNLYA